jgi:glucokinase
MEIDPTLLALDIGGTQVRAALVRGGKILAHRTTTWPSGLSSTEEVSLVADFSVSLLNQKDDAQAGPVAAVGVALAALTNAAGDVVSWPNRPAWSGLPFQALLQARLGLPVVVEDDANAAALAEWAFGAGHSYQHLLVMMVGTGVGAGLILNGTLFRGRHGWAGELGHLIVDAEGPACPCGNRGCLQMLASGRALERLAAERGLPGAVAVTSAAEQGEAWALEALTTSGRWLGLAAANVVNLLDLEAVIIGGGLSGLGPPWWSTLDETLYAHLLNVNHRTVALHRAVLPDTAGLLGAAYLAGQMASLPTTVKLPI